MTAIPDLLFTPEDDVADPPEPPVPTKAPAMIEMLRRHYVPDESKPAGVFAPEIQSPGPTARRADLIWLGCTAATGRSLVGHEVKVTRADVLAELADLTKSDPWQRYCDRWYLVVPHLSLIDGLDLPASWGVLLPPSGRRTRSMTVHRQAPDLRPVEQGPALKTLAAWQLWKLRDARNQADLSDRQAQQLQMVNQELRLRDRTGPEYQVVAGIVAALGGVSLEGGIGDWRHRVQVDDVVAALRDLGSVHVRREQAEFELNSIRRGLEAARRGIDRLLVEVPKSVSAT